MYLYSINVQYPFFPVSDLHIIEDLVLDYILIHWSFSTYCFMLFLFSYCFSISQYILISDLARLGPTYSLQFFSNFIF